MSQNSIQKYYPTIVTAVVFLVIGVLLSQYSGLGNSGLSAALTREDSLTKLSAELEEKTVTDTAYLEKTLSKVESIESQALDTYDLIGNLQSSVAANIDYLDALDSKVSGIPVMASFYGHSEDSGDDTFTVFESEVYPNGAVFRVVLSGVVLAPEGEIKVETKIPRVDTWDLYVPLVERIDTHSGGPLMVEFTGVQCIILADIRDDLNSDTWPDYHVDYYVTVTYIPTE